MEINLFHPKYLRNPLTWNISVFPYLLRTLENHFPHVLGIVWISVLRKIFEKSTTLKYLEFPTLFPYYRSPFSPCFGNCMDFPMLWKLYGFLFHSKYLWNPSIWNVCVFRYLSRAIKLYFPHSLGLAWISASPKIFKKSINLKFFFSHIFPAPWKSTFSIFWELYGFLFQPKY